MGSVSVARALPAKLTLRSSGRSLPPAFLRSSVTGREHAGTPELDPKEGRFWMEFLAPLDLTSSSAPRTPVPSCGTEFFL